MLSFLLSVVEIEVSQITNFLFLAFRNTKISFPLESHPVRGKRSKYNTLYDITWYVLLVLHKFYFRSGLVSNAPTLKPPGTIESGSKVWCQRERTI